MSGFLVTFVNLLFQAFWFAILGRVLISWVDPMGNMRITQILRELTEPILGPIRRVLPTIGMFDFSPIVALLLLNLVQGLIMGAIR